MGLCGADVSDIEDLGKDFPENQKSDKRHQLVPKIRKKKRHHDGENEEKIVCDSVIPGTQTIYVKTWGCSHNNSDSEYMAGLLSSYGYKLTEEPSRADLWLLNSCTVKGPAEDHFRNAVEAGLEQKKHVVVAGCVPQSAPRAPYLKGLSIIGVQQIERVVEVVEEALKGHTVRLFGQKKQSGKKLGGAPLSLPKVRKNPLIEIIPISTGCLNQCTYCKTKHARGELGSYRAEEIVQRAVHAFQEGVHEVWLTSEDTGAYGRDIGHTLPELLSRLVEVVPDGCFVRLGMTNPPYILDHLQEMSEILSHPRVYSFLHIPVQSGSDSVLSDMKREYCRADFETIVDFLKEKVPGISIATDVICGFPTETTNDFEETVDLVRKHRFPTLFINQFYPRPGTPAARLPRISAQEAKRRTKYLTEVFQGYQTNVHNVGSVQEILVTETSHDQKHYVGHNKFYDQVLVPKDDKFLGRTLQVKITSAGKHFLIGEPVCVADAKLPTPPTLRESVPSSLKTEDNSWFASLWWWSCVTVVLAAFFIRLFGNRLLVLLF